MRLTKTRKLLSAMIEKDRQLQIGTPFTDTDIKDVSNELKLFERKYNYYQCWVAFLFTAVLIQCATLVYYLRPEHKPEPPQPRPTYTFGTADTVFSERQKEVYNEIWEK